VRDAVYAWIRQNLATNMGAAFDDRRIWRVEWREDCHQLAEVGEKSALNGEHVVAILYEPERKLYHICTPTQGVIAEPSLVVPAQYVIDVAEFETDILDSLI